MELFLQLCFFTILISNILSFFYCKLLSWRIYTLNHLPKPSREHTESFHRKLRIEAATKSCDKINADFASMQSEFVIDKREGEERTYLRRSTPDLHLHVIFSLQGGERAIEEEIKKEEELRCRRVFFKHKHCFAVFESFSGRCHKCYSSIYGYSVGCHECEIYLHAECATKGVQLNIRHIYHPFHRLTLKSYDSDDGLTRCNACYKKVYAGKFMFDCKSCSYHICIQCSLLKPNIKDSVGQHHHLFTFFPKSSHSFIHEYCKFCGDRCDGDDLIVRCVNCDFNLHLHCFPSLPNTIKHRFHEHQFTPVTDPNLVEADKGYDDENLYCDICEEKRDRKHQVYCCNKCKLAAHVNCVSSEVLLLIPLQESDLVAATTIMLEQSDIQDCHYFGHVTEDENRVMKKFTRGHKKRKEGAPEKVQPLEYYLTNTIGDGTIAREFLAKRKAEEIDRENDDTKIDFPELVALNEKIEKLHKGTTKATKVLESTKADLKDFNSELEKVEAQRAKLLRPQQ